MTLLRLLEKAKIAIEQQLDQTNDFEKLKIVFVSLSDGRTKPTVITLNGSSFIDIWEKVVRASEAVVKEKKLNLKWLRIDWVDEVEEQTWGVLKRRLALTKRNYFRYGIALDKEFEYAFLETEINANAMLYLGVNTVEAGINEKNFKLYFQRKYKKPLAFNKDIDSMPIWIFSHGGVFVSNDENDEKLPGGNVVNIASPEAINLNWRNQDVLNSGRRQLNSFDEDEVKKLIASSANFLARQVGKDGKFIYGHFPNFGKYINTYNTLRHASSVYSLLEACEVFPENESLIDAAKRALHYLERQHIRRYPRPDGKLLAFNVEVNDEIKLGANAVAILAFAQYEKVTGDQKYRRLMEQLAAGIEYMQQGEVDENHQPTGKHPGKFVHVLNAKDLSIKSDFRIVYYDGEAAFGLMRLYGLTKDDRWLKIVEKAFDYFIETDYWKYHDHWLSYCANELTLYRPKEKYFRFAVQNIADYLDFIATRETTFPTLLELAMAFHAMLERIDNDHPEMKHVLEGFDRTKFYQALQHRANYLINGFFWPELAMYTARPYRVVGSFFIRHQSFRVRIDDVEHYLSGYIAYWKMLEKYGNNYSANFLQKQEKSIRPNISHIDVIWGGDVNLGRRQHYRAAELGFDKVLDLPALAEADLSIVNLECVVATTGEQGVPKGEGGPYYYRARPEMLQVLTEAGVDMVTTANNHSGDYGGQAILEQASWLDAAGIRYAGTGKNFEEALKPAFTQVKHLRFAVFSLDATQHRFAASESKAGAAYLSLKDPQQWTDVLMLEIAKARESADVVLVAVHWGDNLVEEPTAAEAAVGRAIIDAGADAILGASAHILQGIEIYRGRPIIYDAGDLLFDSVRKNLAESGLFNLEVTSDGVTKIRFIPVGVGFGFSTQLQGNKAKLASENYQKLCRGLGTNLSIDSDGSAYIDLNPIPREISKQQKNEAFAISHKENSLIEKIDAYHSKLADHAIQQNWIVDSVPEEAQIEPIDFNGMKLIGIKVSPTLFTKREMLYVESFWSCDAPIKENRRISFRAVPTEVSKMPAWGAGMDHDPCDWMMPTSQWESGVIYRDFYGLRPPYLRNWVNGKLQIEVGIIENNKIIKSVELPIYVTLAVPGKDGTPVYRSDFPDIIYQNKPGQTWNAEQLAAITGGEWIVKPPKDWHVNSVVTFHSRRKFVQRPTLYTAYSYLERHRHESYTNLNKNNWDAHKRLPRIYEQYAGSLVREQVQGLPDNFPLLKVDDPFQAVLEIGAANRLRLVCPLVAVTGSAGKTSTLGIFNQVFSNIIPTFTTYDNYNSRGGILVNLASVNPKTELVILEVALSAINSPNHQHIKMIKPTIAIITNIGEAHLKEDETTLDIARKKSNIFNAMDFGSIAIVCRDIEYYEYISKRAMDRGLKLISYGEHLDADIHIKNYNLDAKSVDVIADGIEFSYTLGLPGKHMAINSLACLAVAKIMGIEFEDLRQGFTSTKAIEGRGTVYDLSMRNKNIKIYDESYNANPLSMRAAISMFGSISISEQERKIMVLGDMLELGDDALRYHRDLVGSIVETKVHKVYLVGKLMPKIADLLLEQGIDTISFTTTDEMLNVLENELADKDHILFKSSNGIGLIRSVKQLIQSSDNKFNM